MVGRAALTMLGVAPIIPGAGAVGQVGQFAAAVGA